MGYSSEDIKHSIVLVENDQDILNILSGYFALSRYNVYKTSSAEQCLKVVKDQDGLIDVVFVNGSIAADRGPMLIVNIKKINPAIKIFTLAENENEKTRVLDYGADEFAIKPISPTTVVEKITMLLMKKPAEVKISN